MAESFTLLYQQPKAVLEFDSLCRLLGPLQLSVEHPGTRNVLILDDFGEHVVTTKDDVRASIEQRAEVNVEFWYAENHDLLCQLRFVGDVQVIFFSLRGLSQDECASIRRVILAAIRATDIGVRPLALVFDEEGASADVDWDDVFLGGGTSCGGGEFSLPTLVLLNEDVAKRFEGAKVETFGFGLVRAI